MTTTIRYLAILAIVLFSVSAFGQVRSDPLQVVSVTPSGDEVPVTRGEIIIEFNKKMVAFGQTDKDLSTVPVEIKPGPASVNLPARIATACFTQLRTSFLLEYRWKRSMAQGLSRNANSPFEQHRWASMAGLHSGAVQHARSTN